MPFRYRRRHFDDAPERGLPDEGELPDLDSTGSEASYFRSLVDSKSRVTVVLTNGERIRGRVRYYDRDCFSVGVNGGANTFLRKSSVKYILEE